MIGPSYLGLVQWAVAPEAGDDLARAGDPGQRLAVPRPGLRRRQHLARDGGVVAGARRRAGAPARCRCAMARGLRRLPALLDELPIAELDARATGAEVAWFREAARQPAAATTPTGWRATSPRASAKVTRAGAARRRLVRHLPAVDARGLRRAAGGRARRRSWSSARGRTRRRGCWRAGMREGLAWLRAHLLGRRPTGASTRRVQRVRHRRASAAAGASCRAGRRRAPASGGCGSPAAAACETGRPTRPRAGDRYRYDPADPTPVARRPGAARARARGRQPRRSRRAPTCSPTPRAPLPATVEAIGPCRVELWVRASSPHFDVFARVCDVDADGASWNVCDALARVAPGPLRAGRRRQPGASPSTCGRSGTASPPATASASRSPPAPTRATPATPAPARTPPPPPRLRPVSARSAVQPLPACSMGRRFLPAEAKQPSAPVQP